MIIETTTDNVINSMSYTEIKAVKILACELEGLREREIVISGIADKAHVTRSVFVNVVRRLETCGIVESKSMGVKGMYIKINNPEALQIIAKG